MALECSGKYHVMPEMTQAVGHKGQEHRSIDCGFLVHGFAGRLTPEARNRLLALGSVCRFRPGEFLLHEGEHTDHVLLLAAGRVKVSSTAENGYAVVLGIRGLVTWLGKWHGWTVIPVRRQWLRLTPYMPEPSPGLTSALSSTVREELVSLSPN